MDWWHDVCDRLANNDSQLTELDLHRRLLLWSQHENNAFSYETGDNDQEHPQQQQQQQHARVVVFMPLAQILLQHNSSNNNKNTHLTTLCLTMAYLDEVAATCLARALSQHRPPQQQSHYHHNDGNSSSSPLLSALQHLHLKDEAADPLLHDKVWRILLIEGVAQAGGQIITLGLAACTNYGNVQHLVHALSYIHHLELDCDVLSHHHYTNTTGRNENNLNLVNRDSLGVLAEGLRQSPCLQSLMCICGGERSMGVLNRLLDGLQQGPSFLRELTIRKVSVGTTNSTTAAATAAATATARPTAFNSLTLVTSLSSLMVSPHAPHQLTIQALELTVEEMQLLGTCLLTNATANATTATLPTPHGDCRPTWRSLNLSHCRRLGGLVPVSSSTAAAASITPLLQSSPCLGLQYLRPGLQHPRSTLSHLFLADTAMGNDGLDLLLSCEESQCGGCSEGEDSVLIPRSLSSSSPLPSFALHTLDLTRCHIDNVNPLQFLLVSSSSCLQVLNLNGNMISDDGAHKLSIMLQQRLQIQDYGDNDSASFIELSLSWNRIGATGAVALVTAPCWTMLNLSSNSNVGYLGLQQVAHALAAAATHNTQGQPQGHRPRQQQQRLDLSHTVKLGNGNGFRKTATSYSSNSSKTTNNNTVEEERKRLRNGASHALVQAVQHSNRCWVEFQTEGCELNDWVEEQIQFYIKWNRCGRYLLVQSEQPHRHHHHHHHQPDEKVDHNAAAIGQSTYVPLGLWSLVLAKVASDPNLVMAFLREQPHLILRRTS